MRIRRGLLILIITATTSVAQGQSASSEMSKSLRELLSSSSSPLKISLSGGVQVSGKVESLEKSAQQITQFVKGSNLEATRAMLARWGAAQSIDVFRVDTTSFASTLGSVGSFVDLLGDRLTLVSSWKSSDGRYIHVTASAGEKIDQAAVTFDQKTGSLWGWTNERRDRAIVRPVVNAKGESVDGYHMLIRMPPLTPKVDVVPPSATSSSITSTPTGPFSRRYAQLGTAKSDSGQLPRLDKPLTIYVAFTARALEGLQRDGQTPANLVDNEVGSLEHAFKRAGIGVSVAEAVAEPTAYVEALQDPSVSLESIAKALDTSNTDAALVAVRKRRTELKKDLGILLVSWRRPDECGNAVGIGVTAEHALAVINWACIHNAVAYLHEIGHLLGAYHEIVVPESSGMPRDARAFFYAQGNEPFVTVMGRPQPADKLLCGPIALFSNPYDSHHGITIGEVGKYDNARVVVEGLRRAVNFGESL